MLSRVLALPLILTVILSEGPARAQSWDIYAEGGAGSHNSKLISEPAIGGEVVFGQGIGVGGELGVIAGQQSFGYVSLNGSYHFTPAGASQKIDPFVTGGFTRLFDPLLGTLHLSGGSSNGVDVGIGLHYWFLRHFGLRAEFRDIVIPGASPAANFWAFRGGFAFR